jgi:hypothetical protein
MMNLRNRKLRQVSEHRPRGELERFPGLGFPNDIILEQGDQIRRIFAHWVIVHFGQVFLNYRSSENFWEYVFPW